MIGKILNFFHAGPPHMNIVERTCIVDISLPHEGSKLEQPSISQIEKVTTLRDSLNHLGEWRGLEWVQEGSSPKKTR
jgi:hypothetical protein